jgi:hypothetical protein
MAKEVPISSFIVLSVLFVLISVSATVLFLSKEQSIVDITGAVSGIAEVEVVCIVAISLPESTVNFGAVPQGYVDNTTDNDPIPMIVQNDGSIAVDVSIARDSSSTPLFSGTGGGDNTSSFQFRIDYANESDTFNYSASTTTWTNVPGIDGLTAITGLKYSDLNDSAEIELQIRVPTDEPLGKKNETLNFIGVATQGANCGSESGSCKDNFWDCLDDCHGHDSDCHLSCGYIYSVCIREECITELQSCKAGCSNSDCRRDCNDAFKDCAQG